MSGAVSNTYRPNVETTIDGVTYWPVEEVAQTLGKTRRTIDRYIEAGTFTNRVIYGVSCVPASEVTRYVSTSKGATS